MIFEKYSRYCSINRTYQIQMRKDMSLLYI
nr:MAG TPA: hypothetical protein [Caudoviricetes sp.]